MSPHHNNDLLPNSIEHHNLEKHAFESLKDSIFILDNDFNIIKHNKTAQEVFGLGLDGKYIGHIVSSKDLTDHLLATQKDLSLRSIRVHYTPKYMQQLIAKMHGVIVNKQVYIVLSIYDLHETQKADEKFADFVANASHEIRTPITSLLGMLETLSSEQWGNQETISIFAPIMLEQARRLKHLVTDLYNLSKIETKLTDLPQGKVTLLDLLLSLQLQLSNTLKESNTSLNICSQGNPVITGDFNELTLLYHNLIVNAAKYGGYGAKVIIEVGTTDKFPKDNLHLKYYDKVAYVKVIDNGEGIPSSHIPRLTEKFYRVDKSRSRKIGGAGLGLAMAQQILTRHNGILDIQSNLGDGSIFTTYFGLTDGENN